jgi:hypothetical protein
VGSFFEGRQLFRRSATSSTVGSFFAVGDFFVGRQLFRRSATFSAFLPSAAFRRSAVLRMIVRIFWKLSPARQLSHVGVGKRSWYSSSVQ